MTLRSTVISVIVGMTSVVAPVAAQEPLVQLRRAQARGGGLHADALRLDGRLRMAADERPALEQAPVRPGRPCSTVKRTLIGVAVGAAAAAPLAWAIDERFDNEGGSAGDYVALTLTGGAGAGALVGFFTCQ
jgi:hypothetical protein